LEVVGVYVSGELREKRSSDDGKMVFLSVLEQDEIVRAYAFADAPGLDVVQRGDHVEATVRVKLNKAGNAVSVQVRELIVNRVAGELAAA
jgi:hypothetical protein